MYYCRTQQQGFGQQQQPQMQANNAGNQQVYIFIFLNSITEEDI